MDLQDSKISATKENFYSERLLQWIETTNVFYSSNVKKEDEKICIIAMSRKMPRLLKWINKNIVKNEVLNNFILTEHAIPFCRDLLCQHIISVMDDALYFGSTIDYVTQNLAWSTGKDKISVYPLLMCKTYRTFRNAYFENNIPTINNKDVPFFTTRHARNIMSLGIPMDVEFPILEFKQKDFFLNSELWGETLKKSFDTQLVYKISHDVYNEKTKEYEKIVSYTVILNNEITHEQSCNSDFFKFRFYLGDGLVRVVSYAPLAIPEQMLFEKYPTLFKDTSFEQLWLQVYLSAPSIKHTTLNTSNRIIWDYTSDAYEGLRQKSLVVWANYLHSFSEITRYRRIIQNVLRAMGYDTSLSVSNEDLTYLIGPQLAPEICAKLKEIFGMETPNLIKAEKDLVRSISSVICCIPSDSAEKYHERNRQMWFRCKTASQALSALFSNQHFCIGLFYGEAIDRYQKLRFGVTYNSIYSELSLYSHLKRNLHTNIHQWIDMKIDEGCVAPKYERVKVAENYYWKRMFRAGENEDNYIKIARIGLYIFRSLEKGFQKTRIERKKIEELFAIIFSDPFQKINWDYKFAEIKSQWDKQGKMWRAVLVDPLSGEEMYLTDALFIQPSYFDSIDEVISLDSELYILENERTLQLLESTPMSNSQQQVVDDYSNLYITFYSKKNKNLTNNFFVNQLLTSLPDNKEIWLEASKGLHQFIILHNEDELPNNIIKKYEDDLITLFRQYSVMTITRINLIKEQTLINNKLYSDLISSFIRQNNDKDLLEFFTKVSAVLFYWELFKAAFLRLDYKHVQHSVLMLEKGLNKILPEELKELCSHEKLYFNVANKRKLAKLIIAAKIYDECHS